MLPVAVLHVVGGAVVPFHTDSDEEGWQEPVFGHDGEKGEEATNGLDHACTKEDQRQRKTKFNRKDIFISVLPSGSFSGNFRNRLNLVDKCQSKKDQTSAMRSTFEKKL